jgi:hypothetical protein
VIGSTGAPESRKRRAPGADRPLPECRDGKSGVADHAVRGDHHPAAVTQPRHGLFHGGGAGFERTRAVDVR